MEPKQNQRKSAAKGTWGGRRRGRACPERPRRGSRRSAPKGNLNAFKHGRYSMQFAALGAVMASDPKLRDTLLALAERHGLKQAKAEEIGWEVLLRFLKYAGDIAAGRTKRPFLPDDLRGLPD